MANTPYENFFLENEIEDQFDSHLNLQQFLTIDNNLVGEAGRKVTVHKYSASDSVTGVEQGYGNVGDSEAGYVSVDYTIETAQGRFKWYDEEAQKDPTMVLTGTRHLGTDMFNYINGKAYAEFKKASMIVPVSTKFKFSDFANAQSMFNFEDADAEPTFAFVAPADVAAIRTELGDSLKYVEAFVRNGYVGTVAGTNIYTKKDATPGTIVVATKQAVTLFNKTGIEYEAERDANTRMNRSYVRKHFVVALTDATKCVNMILGATFTLSEDTVVSSSKTYYALTGLGYTAVVPAESDNPVTKGWYELGE